MKNWRIFWYCSTFQSSNGYYYHKWINWLFYIEVDVFAGYNKFDHRSKKSTFKDALNLYI